MSLPVAEKLQRRFYAERFSAIPEDLDILLAHTPPCGYRDLGLDGAMSGSRALLNAIDHRRPRLVIRGHIHEGRGVRCLGSYHHWTVIANCSHLDWDFQPRHDAPMRFRIPAKRSDPAWRVMSVEVV